MISSELQSIYRQFPLKALTALIRSNLEANLAFFKSKLATEYARYDDATKKGVPFAERQNLIDPIRTSVLERLIDDAATDLKGFRVIPYEEWLEEGDYGMMKSLGFKRFIQITMHHAYVRTSAS